MITVWNWIRESNRWKHLLGGLAIGALSDSVWCAGLAGLGIAGALEFKDRAHGGKWDWTDFGMTVLGTALGFGVRLSM